MKTDRRRVVAAGDGRGGAPGPAPAEPSALEAQAARRAERSRWLTWAIALAFAAALMMWLGP